MYKEQNETPFIVELSRNFTVIFTMSVLAISAAGLLLARYAPEAQDISTLFALKETGLPYSAILQIAGLAFILAVFCILITSDRFLVKMQFLLRFFLFLLTTFFTTSVFVVIFKWFPIDNVLAWINYALSIIICFAIASGITFLRFKVENKKYNRLLTNFKARHKDN